MRFYRAALAGVVILTLLPAQPLAAAVIVREYAITASSFLNFNSDPAPFNSLSISFRVSYDDAVKQQSWKAVDFFQATTDGRINQGPFSTAARFSYYPAANGFAARLIVAGNSADPVNVNVNPDFYFSFDPAAAAPRRVMNSVTVPGKSSFFALNAAFSQIAVTSAVPEPATWAMLLVGFGAIGFAMRRLRYNGRVSCA